MEKAILKTLSYADIFDYPLKAWEIHKWLIGKKMTLKQVEKTLKRKGLESRIKNQGDFYFLKERKGLVKKRLQREKDSAKLMRQAVWVANILKVIPTIKLIGVSGNLAMENATTKDDIDFFIVTRKGKLWVSRLATLILLNFLGKRRSRDDKNVSGKICVNLLLEEDQLIQKFKDLYTAHEILQMKLLWQRDEVYSKFLEDNEWVFKFLPNWTSSVKKLKVQDSKSKVKKEEESYYRGNVIDGMEYFVRVLQLRYMGLPTGKERVSETALYFHPNDYREKILKSYRETIAKIS